MTQIVPTITVTTPDDYARDLEKLAFAPRIHIDIADGEFAPNRTVNLNQVYWDENKTIDLHLMMKRPGEWLHQIVALNPSLVILHAETDEVHENLPQIFDHLRKFGIRCGVALLPKTQPESAVDIIKIADHVLIFGGRLGFQGGIADFTQLEKVAKIREINRGIEIAWDGGANIENVAEIAGRGVDVINVGSMIMRTDDPEKSYKDFIEVINA